MMFFDEEYYIRMTSIHLNNVEDFINYNDVRFLIIRESYAKHQLYAIYDKLRNE